MSNQSKPVYMKLRDMIAAAIIDGRYAEGEMLPSVRALAAAGPDGPPRRLGARIAGRRLTAPAALAPAGRFASLRQPSSSATV